MQGVIHDCPKNVDVLRGADATFSAEDQPVKRRQDEIDVRLKQTVSKLNKRHGLQEKSNKAVNDLIQKMSKDELIVISKDFKVPYSQGGGKRLKHDALIDSFLRQNQQLSFCWDTDSPV